MNSSIFIPFLTVSQLMLDNSKFYLDYSFKNIRDLPAPGLIQEKILGYGRAVLEVCLEPPHDIEQDPNMRRSILTDAIIDTGASISVVHSKFIKTLGAVTFEGAEIAGLNLSPQKMKNTNISIHIYDVFPNAGLLNICPVVHDFVTPNDGVDIGFIIGWDILRYCEFKYDGVKRVFDLKFIPENSENLSRS